MAPKANPAFTILAPFWFRFSGIDFLMRFGRLLSPFWRPFAAPLTPLGSLCAPSGLSLAPFGSILAPFSEASGFILIPVRFSGCLLLPFWLQFCCFLIFDSFSLFWMVFDSVFDRLSNANTIFGVPNPARNPQQNYSRISTVGNPTFLGPGRVCCRRQLKIGDEIDPVQTTHWSVLKFDNFKRPPDRKCEI